MKLRRAPILMFFVLKLDKNDTVFREWGNAQNISGYTDTEWKVIRVSLSGTRDAARYYHRSFVEELCRTVDHEMVHVYEPDSENRENQANAFERAGAWTRR